MLTNPGSRQALVQGEALTSSGPFRPSALADLTIPPRSVLVTDITDVVDNASTALHLTSSVEVTAGVVSTVSNPGPEFAVSTTSETLTSRPAVLPFLRDLRTTVCFAMADRAGAAATVVYVDKQGAKMQRRQIQVRGGASTCRRLVPGPGSAYALVSSDSPGVVQAAAHFSGPAGLSTVAIAPGPWEVVRPAVEPAP